MENNLILLKLFSNEDVEKILSVKWQLYLFRRNTKRVENRILTQNEGGPRQLPMEQELALNIFHKNNGTFTS